MINNFSDVIELAKKSGQRVISVAAANDKDVLEGVKAAQDAGLAKAILVGDTTLIEPLVTEVGLSEQVLIIHEPDAKQAALTAVKLVRDGQAQILMKGLVNSGDFLKAVLNADVGLRTGRLLSHLAAFEAPGAEKLIFHTDGGMNIAPNLDEKKDILTNSLLALNAMGVAQPKVAILTANEVVNPKMPATVDAKALVDMQAAGELFADCILEGPIAMDVALNPEAAKHKGITSAVAGDVDLFLLPGIEAGNILAKALIYYAQFKFAGVILGATHPIVMGSRSDSAATKLNSIALACLMTGAVK